MTSRGARVGAAALLVGACGTPAPGPQLVPAPTPSAPSSAPPVASAPASSSSAPPEPPPVAAEPEACPSGMVHVVADRCPELVRKCVLAPETSHDNRHLCTRFSPERTCATKKREHMDFCIDRFEFPNEEGAHPLGLASWYDAATTCEGVGKRLCWEAEWVTACEGPDELPFPYGLERDPTACNMDVPAQMVLLDRLLSRDPERAKREMMRLDRSRPSGSMPRCKSGFGVFDLTGNFDEWANGESNAGKGAFATLLGGSWIRSRNQCRGRMSGHEPRFRFHTLGFRCCADARGREARAASGGAKPPKRPADPKPYTWPGHDLSKRGF